MSDPTRTAIDLHKGAIRLLRLLRREDGASGLSAPRLSALSVLAFGGPSSPSALAAAEQVALPTMSRLLKELERDGLVQRTADPVDGRSVRMQITAAGQHLMEAGRRRRLERLQSWLDALPVPQRRKLEAALPVLLGLGAEPARRSQRSAD